jgi:Fic family protein
MDNYMDMSLNIDTLQITPEILALISELDEFKGAWRALGTLAPERLSALRRVATIESIGSSTRIEGSKLSDRAVELLLSNLGIRKFDTRDEQEVAGYAEVMETVFAHADATPSQKATSNSYTVICSSTVTRMSDTEVPIKPIQITSVHSMPRVRK